MKICPRCSEVYPDDSDRCGFDGSLLRQEVDSLLGKTVAQRYRLISRVGAGRISIVYLARHVMIDRLSALKILRPNLAKNRALGERFLHEARAVNRINHDNIVEISDYGEANGIVYLVMEYVPGETMKKHMSQGLFAWPRAASIGIQIASALGRAHQMGIVHRDVSPTSVLLVKKKDGVESVKLIDFGVAKIVDHAPAPDTVGGVSLPGYAAPETIGSGRSDPQSDLYALGAVLYEAISGVLPSGTMAGGRPPAGWSGPLPLDQRVPHVPESLARVVMQLLAARAENRQRDAFIVLDELTTVLRDHGRGLSRAPPPPPSSASFEPSPATLRTASRPQAASRPTPTAVVVPQSGDVAAASSPSDLGYRPPDMNARPLAELEPLCREGLLNIERAIAHHDEVAPEAARMLAEVRRLIDSIALAGEAVRRAQADIAKREAQSSEVKANFGRALDELGHDLSRANALVTDIDSRIAKLQKQRESELTAQVGQHDAWLWEQGALSEEVQRARAWGHDLIFQISELRKRLDGQSEELDSELARARAALEGNVAALRTLARETWGAIEQSAQMLGIPMSRIGPRP